MLQQRIVELWEVSLTSFKGVELLLHKLLVRKENIKNMAKVVIQTYIMIL